jgi:hypothetical protein
MKTNLLPVGCTLLLFLAGCSSTSQYVKFPDQSRKLENPALARIYVIRSGDIDQKSEVDVLDGRLLVGSTGPKGYLCWERKAGDTTITSLSKGASRISLKMAPGGVYYLVQETSPGRWYVSTSLKAVSEEQGQAALKDLKVPMLAQSPRVLGGGMSPEVNVIGAKAPTGFSGGGSGGSSGVISFQVIVNGFPR